MTRPEQPRHSAEPDPHTTPLPTSNIRTLRGTSQLGDPATSKIALPNQRAATPDQRAAVPEQRAAAREKSGKSGKPVNSASEPASTETQADRHRRGKAAATARPRGGVLITSVLIGAVVSIALGVYGRLHVPTGYAVNLAGFSGAYYVKAWLASVTGLFAVIQLISALVFTRKRNAPSWVGWLHRWSGRIAVLVSVPVAMHCLFALGFQFTSTRVLLHSLAGCLFYGAFTTKMLSLTRPGTPRWAVPLFGGLVFTILVALWLSSALWLFQTQGVHL